MKSSLVTVAVLLTLSATHAAEPGPDFPGAANEISLRVTPTDDGWEVTSSWATPRDRTCVVESLDADGKWVAFSETFEGDGKPVDILDRIQPSDAPLTIRFVSWPVGEPVTSSRRESAKISVSVTNESDSAAPVISLLMAVPPGPSFQLQSSDDLLEWNARLVLEPSSVEFEVIDNDFPLDSTRHYRLVALVTGEILPDGTMDGATGASRGSEPLTMISATAKSSASGAGTGRDLSRRSDTLRSKLPPHRVVRSLRFETREQRIRPGMTYATIKFGGPAAAVGINKFGEVLRADDVGDGTQRMILWIAGENHDLSAMSGVSFHQVLDIDDARAVVGTVLVDGQEELVGFRYEPRKDAPPKVRPLSKLELREFKLEKHVPIFDGEITVQGKTFRPTSRAGEVNASGILINQPIPE